MRIRVFLSPWPTCRIFLSLCIALLLIAPDAWAENAPPPQSFDLRDVDGHAFIGPVKNQSSMGTCYSFAAAAAAESTYNRAMNLSDKNGARFSESFIIWSLSPHYEGFDPYNGANYDYDELQALVDYGLPNEEIFPYVMTQPHDMHWDAPRTKFNSWHRIPTNDIETMKRVLQTFGAIDAAVLVEDPLSEYTEGIFSDTYTAPRELIEFRTESDHAISLVGWDDNADGQGHGAWILRNSWGPDWGLDGYMLIDYTSAAVATSATYLVYGDWPGENFSLENTVDIVAPQTYSGAQPVARGIYEWGGTLAEISNNARIVAEANVESGWPYVHGIFLWAGAQSSVTNAGDIVARAESTDGHGTAYGISMQGRDIVNSGTINAFAGSASDARTTAYGVRQFGFDLDATFTNTGSIFAEAPTEDGWAYGYFGSRIGHVDNTGQIQANAAHQAAALIVDGGRLTRNTGLLKAESSAGSAIGAIVLRGDLENTGNIVAEGNENANGIMAGSYDLDVGGGTVTNTGSISAFSESGSAVGARLYKTALINSGEIAARTNAGTATAIDAQEASVINTGQVIGTTLLQTGSSLSGHGLFSGDVRNTAGVVAPGSSVGTMTINGDYYQEAAGSLFLEFGQAQHDVLYVSGNAALDGELRLALLDYQDAGTFAVLNASSVTGSFATLNIPAVLNAALTTSPDGLDLNLTRNSYASLAANTDQRSLANVLDTVRTEASADMGAALLRVDNMDRTGVGSALKDMAPGIEVAARRALADLPHSETGAIMERMEEHVFQAPQMQHPAAPITGDELPGYTVWGNIALSAGRQNAGDVVPDLTSQTTNFFLGVEKTHGHWTTGVTTTLLQHNLNGKDDDSRATITSMRAYLHTLWRQHARDTGSYVAASLGAGRSRVSTVRDISFLDTDADAQHWAQDASLALGAGHVFTPGAWRIHPHVKLTGVLVQENAVEEHGAGSMDLDIDSGDIMSVQSALGLRIGRTISLDTLSIFPEAHIQWVHALSSDQDQLHCKFNEFTPDFAIDSTYTHDILRMSAGLTLAAKNLRSGLHYEYSIHDGGDITAHQVNLELRFLF